MLTRLKTALLDVAAGAFDILHHGLALTGVVVVFVVVTLTFRADLLLIGEDYLYALLVKNQPQDVNTAKRATAIELNELPKAQAAVANWLAKKYGLVLEPMGALVAEAYRLSKETRLSPHLILAVAAIESNFHPYIQSKAGAQGLMQVMTSIHRKRYEAYGGNLAAFDPIINMRVGVNILQDFIKLQGGSIDNGLRAYLGGLAVEEDGGYVGKVKAEQARLDRVAAGQTVPFR